MKTFSTRKIAKSLFSHALFLRKLPKVVFYQYKGSNQRKGKWPIKETGDSSKDKKEGSRMAVDKDRRRLAVYQEKTASRSEGYSLR